MIKYLLGLNHSPFTLKPNKLLIPVTAVYPSEESIAQFNDLYHWAINNIKNKIVRTRSGGISVKRLNFRAPMWDVRATNNCIELTFVLCEGCWRIQMRFGSTPKEENAIYGKQAFEKLKNMLRADGIDIDTYAIDNGAEIKKEIEKTMIKLENPAVARLVWDNVHHIDIHSAWPAGLVAMHPEFKPTIEMIYNKRKENSIYKAVLNMSIGYMQSIHCCGARWAQLSRDAINYNNAVMRDLAQRLKSSGRTILAYNTDGIWYTGEVYHGEGEGKGLGQWENDHVNCKWRAKSAGRYEFMEDGIYTPVVRGRTRLDRIKPREEWEWGDVMKDVTNPIEFMWIDGEGIKIYDEEI